MEKNKVKIDGIDKEIIRMLIENARRPILEIAKKIGISGAAIHQRLRKLEKSELINGSSISIDPKILGYAISISIPWPYFLYYTNKKFIK